MHAFRTGVCLAILLLQANGIAGDVVEQRDPALALTLFRPAKFHTVKSHYRLAAHQLKLIPFVRQSFDRSKTDMGLGVHVVTTFSSFTFAPVVITADGKASQFDQDWSAGTSFSGQTAETIVSDETAVRALAAAKEAFITVLFSRQAPFDRITFKLSPEQLQDCRLMVSKYDEIAREKK